MKPLYFPLPDRRLEALARLAAEEQYPIRPKAPAKDDAPCIFLFPPSVKEAEVLPFLEGAPRASLFLLGRASPSLKACAEREGISLLCLMDEPRYLASNSRCTAEGVLASVIEHIPVALSEICILVYGFGNCGREIARLLWLCGCEVWVWSREKGQKKAREDGFNVYCAPTLGLGMFDAVVGTVPDAVYPPSLLSTLRSECFFFQVASGNAGIDPHLLSENGVTYVPLPGLPARFTPQTEAQVIWSILNEHLTKQEGTPL